MPATHAPGALDHALTAIILLLGIYEWRWYWPEVLRALAARVPGTRARVYRNILVGEWLVTAAVAFVWMRTGRPWDAFRLGPASPVRIAIALVVVAAYVAFALWQVRAILARPAVAIERVARRFSYADPLMPRTGGERVAMAGVALTAGLCEEFLFRGFALWYFTALAGPVAGFALAALLFGLGHLYLGYAHVLRTTLLGAVFGAIVLLAGSLWPAIVLHAAIDAIGGEFGYRLSRAVGPGNAGAATAPA
jgi:membrane protease YdiL (CAAX protease family)